MAHALKDNDKRLDRYVDEVENFLTATEEARCYSERDRDYVDHRQWTAEEAAVLEARGQQPVVINRIKRKVNILTGIQKQTRNDPKALPRTPQHEQQADSCTAALRYVADNVEFDSISSDCFEDKIVWGYNAAIVEIKDGPREPEISIKRVAPDRFYFDPYSREKDFSDAGYMGIIIWMDAEEAKLMFPDKAEQIDGMFADAADFGGDTFRDRPEWVDRERGRLRVAQHYCREGGQWYVSYFTDRQFLIDPQPSGYLDENGEPDCPIEAMSAYVNIDNERYGEVRGDVWIQDEINHRRSKLLLSISTRQTLGELGAVDDVNEMKRQMARADGHVTINPEMRFEILPNDVANQTQFALYQESKQEIDQIGMAAASGGLNESTLSGAAIERLQQGGMSELTSLYDGHRNWERRIYRQIWNRIRQFWDGPKWIRVTDSNDSMEWVGLNQPVTIGEKLQELAQQGHAAAQAALQEMVARQDPRLNAVAEVQNAIAELDVDIVLSEVPDYATLRREQFETLATLAQAYGPQAVPFEVMLELSDIPGKEDVKKLLQGDIDPQTQQAMAAEAQMVKMLQMRGMEADVAKKEASAMLDQARAATEAKKAELTDEEIDQKQIETVKLAAAPIDAVNVSV